MTTGDHVQQLRLNDILPELKENGVMALYDKHKATIENVSAAFFHKAQGIHGIMHAKRVLLLSLILSNYNQLNEQDRNILILASIYHDIGRTNDWKCEVHGHETVRKLEAEGLCNDLPAAEKEILYFIIIHHCIQDETALQSLEQSAIKNKERAKKLFAIFKDSDALDRCRIGDLDIRYLRNEHSLKLTQVAQDLFHGGLN